MFELAYQFVCSGEIPNIGNEINSRGSIDGYRHAKINTIPILRTLINDPYYDTDVVYLKRIAKRLNLLIMPQNVHMVLNVSSGQ